MCENEDLLASCRAGVTVLSVPLAHVKLLGFRIWRHSRMLLLNSTQQATSLLIHIVLMYCDTYWCLNIWFFLQMKIGPWYNQLLASCYLPHYHLGPGNNIDNVGITYKGIWKQRYTKPRYTKQGILKISELAKHNWMCDKDLRAKNDVIKISWSRPETICNKDPTPKITCNQDLGAKR